MAFPSSARSAHNAKVLILPSLLLGIMSHQRTLLLLLHRLRLIRRSVAAAPSAALRAVHSKLSRPNIESATSKRDHFRTEQHDKIRRGAHRLRSDGATDGLQLGSTCQWCQNVRQGRRGAFDGEDVMATERMHFET
jgi:hypothetical protein